MASTHFSGIVYSENGFEGTFPQAITQAVAATTVAASGAVTAGTLAVGTGGSILSLVKKGTIAVDLASTLTQAVTEVTLTITGAAVGDTVIMNPPAAGNTAGFCVGGSRVSATNTVKLRMLNGSAGTIDEGSQTWDYCLLRV